MSTRRSKLASLVIVALVLTRKWIAILEEFGQIRPDSVKAEDVFTNAYNPHTPIAAQNPRVSP